MKILLDTNFLIDAVKFRISLDGIGDLIQGQYTLATLSSVIHELSQISSKRTKSSRYARTALKLLDEYKIEVLKTSGETDKALLTFAKVNFTIATNDRELKKKLKAFGKKTIYLKAKKHLAIG